MEIGKLPEPPKGMFWDISSSEDAEYFSLYLKKTFYRFGIFKAAETVERASVFPNGDNTGRLEADFIREAEKMLRNYHTRIERRKVVDNLIYGEH